MSRPIAPTPVAPQVNVDPLLLDSYLLVIELRQGGSVQDGDALRDLCARQVVEVGAALKKAGVSQRNVDHISYAQCALLDETVLACGDEATRAQWAQEPLQARYFARHQAGKFLYEEMRDVLREPSPDLCVLTVYHRVLMLGFLGRYSETTDPERQQLVDALNERVPPSAPDQALPTLIDARGRGPVPAWLRAPLLHLLVVGGLLAGLWWLLDSHLTALVASLLIERV
ncbi:type VI secretion system protein TssL, short form [Pseudomonas sp. ME-P-057]|jgi:type VI secretion system protein ImpK|uniref:type VI secretion system protein TssL, short form n=1 Tax=Pseudomonas sp. ME-P-057 TaxID=3040321 RepID=UPI0025541E7E|nr:type VI secretion system protein TssL, short form [Pseudomonas sp. ME-P-057]